MFAMLTSLYNFGRNKIQEVTRVYFVLIALGGLIEAETVEAEVERFPTVVAYIRACGGFIVAFCILMLFALVTFSNIFSNWWLSYWFRQGDGVSDTPTYTPKSLSYNLLPLPPIHRHSIVLYPSLWRIYCSFLHIDAICSCYIQ